MIFTLDRGENIVEKGENAGKQHFLLYPQCFRKPSSSRSLKRFKGFNGVMVLSYLSAFITFL